MTGPTSITARLASLIAGSFAIEAPAPDVDLIDGGVLDSFQVVEMLVRIEEHFGCRLDIETIDLDDLRTLSRIAGLIAARVAGAAPVSQGTQA